MDGVKLFNGIVCRSNYSNRHTDVSPSFDFEFFKNATLYTDFLNSIYSIVKKKTHEITYYCWRTCFSGNFGRA